MDQATIEQGIADLERHGFSAAQNVDHIVAQDPVHSCGHGASAGRLILTGYETRVLKSTNAVNEVSVRPRFLKRIRFNYYC